ncbi:amidophosphoribosyltransferase [Candidatus Saccharibacteria bacterium]|nr:MAG: amidophosphoribosyltransferase [Candidatus Saccharibacteria bacterium]
MSHISHDRLRERCAVVGVSVANYGDEAAKIAYQALFALQHRGVEASGIATNASTGGVHAVRRLGMVRDVFRKDDLLGLTGSVATGHNRYSTNGDKNDHPSPIVNSDTGDAQSHNGNLPDTSYLDDMLRRRGYRVNQYNDSGKLGKATFLGIADSGGNIEESVRDIISHVDGAYACTGIHDDMMYTFRDAHGVRPLELGTFDGGVVAASETCALDTIGAEHLRSVQPGELVVARNGLIIFSAQLREPTPHFDMFELVYFARPDSVMLGERVSEVRRRFGHQLATLHGDHLSTLSHPLIVPVPDTSVFAAEGLSEQTHITHEMAIIKNRYVGRTFMQPSQESRRSSLQIKHTMNGERISGRDIVLVDDSIVRGNTLPRLVQLARSLGARSVTILIASPPIRYPDFYGTDTPDQRELMAANLTVEQMRLAFGADYLGFLSVSTMVSATGQNAEAFNLSPFLGDYPIPIGDLAKNIRTPISLEYTD